VDFDPEFDWKTQSCSFIIPKDHPFHDQFLAWYQRNRDNQETMLRYNVFD